MVPQRMSSPRVLFVHGLESRANGSKTILLRAQGFDVRAHEMHMGVLQLSRKNSVVRMALRLTELQFISSVVVATLGLTRSKNGLLLASTLGAGWLALRKNAVMGQALLRSFDACVDIQRAAVLQEKPEIIVGSSWGGAIVAELMRRGDWNGPTVLLAPAIHRVCTKTGQGTGLEIARQLRGKRIVIFHDPTDDVVPFADSEALAAEGELELRAVDGGGHRLMGICEDGRLADTLRAMVL